MVRVVSLLPAATEAAAESGCLGSLVGISPECCAVVRGSAAWDALVNFPRVVAEPKHSGEAVGGAVSASELDATHAAERGASAEIGLGPWGPRGGAAGAGAAADAAEATTADRVAVMWQLSAYCVHADALRELRPDAVVTNVQGGAPAVPAMTGALRRWTRNPRLNLVHLDPQTLADCAADVVKVATACHAPVRGAARAAELTAALARVRAEEEGPQSARRIAVCQWTDPVYTASAWTAELVGVAAPWAISVPRGPAYGPWDPAQLRGQRPDLVVVAVCGFGVPESVREAVAMLNKAFPAGTPAPRVVVADARRVFTVAGPASVAQAASLLASMARGKVPSTPDVSAVALERSDLTGTWASSAGSSVQALAQGVSGKVLEHV